MKIAFLALRGCCDYNNIGGAESVLRRIIFALAKNSNQVDYVIYNSDSDFSQSINSNVRLRYFKSFTDALSIIDKEYEHILAVHIAPKDRLRYSIFQHTRSKHVHFYKLMLGTPSSIFRWAVFLFEIVLSTRNGIVFTISPKTSAILSYLRVKNCLLLPPVPESYYAASDHVKRDGYFTLSYIGRIAPEKGTNEVFDLFDRLKNFDGIHTQVYGYRWSDDRTALRMEHHSDGKVSELSIEASESIYTPEMEEHIQYVLRNTDILVLPYCSIKGTIDPPLLLLEAMFCGCPVLTRPVGNVPAVYGKSPFVIQRDNFIGQALALIRKIKNNPELLEAEHRRVIKRTAELEFSSEVVTRKLMAILQH